MSADEGEDITCSVSNVLRYHGYRAPSSLLAVSNSLPALPASPTLTLSPNPAREYMMVNGLPANDKAVLTVTSASGTRLAFYFATNASQYRIDVSRLPAGVYYVQIVTGDKTDVQTFIKE